MDYEIVTEQKIVTPEEAGSIVENYNIRNRNMSPARVSEFVGEIQSGRFMMIHQGYARDRNGYLMDGQTRLKAISLAGIPVKMLEFTYDLDLIQKDGSLHPVMMVLDKNRPRSVANNLQLNGLDNSVLTAAICNVIIGLLTGTKHRSNENTIVAVRNLYRDDIDEVIHAGWGNKDRKAPVMGVLTMFHAAWPLEAKSLIRNVIDQDGLAKHSAEWTLSRFIREQLPQMTGGVQRNEAIDRIVNACIKYLDREKIASLCANESSKRRFLERHKTQQKMLVEKSFI